MEDNEYINSKRRPIYLLLLLTTTLFLSCEFFALAYSPFYTHPNLTEEIANLWNLKNDNHGQKISEDEIQWMRKGATEEDEPARWINHFYDPVHKTGWSGNHFGTLSQEDGLWQGESMSLMPAIASVDWVTNQEYQAAYGRQYGNQTWQKSIRSYIDGDRKAAFTALGHILHLVEDASVPDHTRDDTHADIYGDPGSPYENYSKEYTNANELSIADNLKNDDLLKFGTIQTAFEYLASYSNNNFFSEDTISNEEFNSPNLKTLKTRKEIINDEVRIYLYSNKGYLARKDIDGFNIIYTINDKSLILPSYFSSLSSQAVLTGASVLDLFFREVEKYRKDPQLLPETIPDSYEALSTYLKKSPRLIAVNTNDVLDEAEVNVKINANATLNFISGTISVVGNTLSSAYNSAKATISSVVTINVTRPVGDFATSQTASLLDAVSDNKVVVGPVVVSSTIQGVPLDGGVVEVPPELSSDASSESVSTPVTKTIQSLALDKPLVFTGGAMPIVAAPAYVAPQTQTIQTTQETQTTQTAQNDQTTQTVEETPQNVDQATTTPDVTADVTSTTTPDIIVDITLPISYSFSDLNSNGTLDSEEANVVVDANATLPAGAYRFNNLTIASSSTLTLQGDPTSSSTFKGVKIVASNITVEVGSSISADYQGYKTGGPGSPSSPAYLAGASYGGVGTGGGVPSYGDARIPTELGSNGGVCCGNYQGGGGAMQFIVSETFLNNGIVTANGSGSSSGGSIYGVVSTLAGAGIFQANGGAHSVSSVYHGRGGGGRTAVYYQASSFEGELTARGGCSSIGMGYSYECAEDGTAGLFDTKNNDLYVTSSWRFRSNEGPFNLNRIVVKDGAHVVVEDGVQLTAKELHVDGASTFSVSGSPMINIPAISVRDSSTLIFSGKEALTMSMFSITGTSTVSVLQGSPLLLHVQDITISSDSKINLDNKGYSGGTGPGAPIEFYDGASYGGVGYNNSATSTYGSIIEPVDMGSGGNGHQSYAQGGGALKIVADGTFVLDGTISARGGITSSGGSIYIIAHNLTGSGQLVVDGGGPYWQGQYIGPGGGGRTAVTAEQYAFTGSMSALGGCARFDGWTMSCAGNGTIENSNKLMLTEEVQTPAPDEVPAVDLVVDDMGDTAISTATSTTPIIEDPDTTPPSITSYTLNGNEGNIETSIASSSPITLVLNASENVDWVSVKIEHSEDAGIYKVFYSGTECVDGTTTCTKVWDTTLSKGDLIEGTYRIKVHIRDTAGNDFAGYLEPYVITVLANPAQNDEPAPILEVLDPVL